MRRDWMRRSLPLAAVALLAAGCGDGNDPTDPLENFDAAALTTAMDATFAPIESSGEPTWVLADFYGSVLVPQADGGALVRAPRVSGPRSRALSGGGIVEVQRTLGLSAQSDIPAEIQGKTFIYNPDTAAWEVDASRTGAPATGVRVVWYAIDATGMYVLPLQERGYIDITDEDTATRERIGVEIVRTAGGTVTLSDFIYGSGYSDDGTTWQEHYEITGFFGDGTQQVDVAVTIGTEGTWSTLDETHAWDIRFEGTQGSYRSVMSGSWDNATSSYEETFLVTVNRAGATTVLDLSFTGDDVSGTGTGTLSHEGALIANITFGEQNMVLTKAGGGSFTSQQQSELQTVILTMFVYGPMVLLNLPFFSL